MEPQDLAVIATPTDLLGVNYYRRRVTATGPEEPLRISTLDPPGEYTAKGFEVYPAGLHEVLTRVSRDYAPAEVYVTENGAAYADERDPDGRVHDPQRVSFLERHIEAARRAVEDGVPLRGYFAWSLLDNFEWRHGYSQRFGLVHVDFETQRRTVKDSGRLMRTAALTNGRFARVAAARRGP